MSKAAKSSRKKSSYLPDAPSRTPLTHDEFCDIMRPFWKQRKRLQRAGKAMHPQGMSVSATASIAPTAVVATRS